MSRPRPVDAAAALVDRALQETLAHAVRAPFYRRRFGETWRRVQTVADLPLLPVLDKATAIAHQRQLLVGRPDPGFGIASSGTTRADGAPVLDVQHCAEEFEAWERAPWPDGAPAPPRDRHPGWTLVAVGVHHGLPGEPGPDELYVPWTLHRNALHMIHALLSRPQPDGRRVTAMRIGAGALKTFLAWSEELGLDTSGYRVRDIGTNGSRLSPHWRRQVRRRLGARVVDNYSISELHTPASQCHRCGRLHFGWPPVAWEVVDVDSGEPVGDGVGRLLLTGLYPFVQKMPLVRYDTGDVVRVSTAPCAAAGKPAFDFLGRLRRGLVLPQTEGAARFLLAPAHVQDVLEALPETERSVHVAVKVGFVRAREIGLPRWTAQLERRRKAPPVARLQFETTFTPGLFPERTRALESTVRRRLQQLEPDLRAALRRREVDLQVDAVPPQTLTPPPDKFE